MACPADLVSCILYRLSLETNAFSVWDGRRNPDLPTHVLSTRTVHDHAQKPKFWSRAFSTSAVKDYGDTISRRAAQLADEIERSTKQNEGKAVELQKWFSYFA